MFENLSVDEKRQLARIAQNAAILAQHVAATAQIAEQVIAEVEQITGCMHPMEARADATSMGGPREFFCQRCQTMINEADSPEFFPTNEKVG